MRRAETGAALRVRLAQPYFSRMPSTKDRMPRASASAAPTNRLPIWLAAADGLRSAPVRKLPKMLPTPMPAPIMPRVARPAPMSLAASGFMFVDPVDGWTFEGEGFGLVPVAEVDHIVEVDAGQNREDEGLKEGHQEFQGGQGDHHGER